MTQCQHTCMHLTMLVWPAVQIVAININTPPGSSSQRIISILQVGSQSILPRLSAGVRNQYQHTPWK